MIDPSHVSAVSVEVLRPMSRPTRQSQSTSAKVSQTSLVQTHTTHGWMGVAELQPLLTPFAEPPSRLIHLRTSTHPAKSFSV